MQNNEALLERPDYKVHFRSYSDKLYGVRVFLDNETHYIINDTLKSDAAIETLYRLKDLSPQYSDYGFIMLQKGNRLFVDSDYKISLNTGNFVSEVSTSKVVSMDKYKRSKMLGFEDKETKNRWDLE